jgi:RHS repeat-associated protein
VTNDAGMVVTSHEYLPFGEDWITEGDTKNAPKYNSQELDKESGYYFYNARHYDPEIGRFVTADNVVDGEYSVKGWNRYTYCGNNPINYKDPTGHDMMKGVEIRPIPNRDKGSGGAPPIKTSEVAIRFLKEAAMSLAQFCPLFYTGDKTGQNHGNLLKPPKTLEENIGQFLYSSVEKTMLIMGGVKALSNIAQEVKGLKVTPKISSQTKDIVSYKPWPPNNGFLGNFRQNETTEIGQKLSRIGSLDGSYTAPPGTTISQRGLSSNYPDQTETLWDVVKKFNYEGGISAPWKDASGLGIQQKLPDSINNLWRDGFIKPSK